MSAESLDWEPYTLPEIRAQFPAGSRVIDVGCGNGVELKQLVKCGCIGIGLDVDADTLTECRRSGLSVVLARAESMPLRAKSFDGLICTVAVPYTDESLTMREIGRILKPGARAYFCYHGFGYFLRYVFLGPTLKMRFYGARSMLSTWFYRLAGRRLAGFWGDTLYQTEAALQKYYARDGLKTLQKANGRTFLGFPVFMYHTVERI